MHQRRGDGSILRLDHVQPLGAHQNAYEPTGYALSQDALVMVRDQLDWLMSGSDAPPKGELSELRAFLAEAAAW